MRRYVLMLAAMAGLMAGLGAPSASARMIITEDLGGPIQQYERRYALMQESGEPIVIDGPCLSACTLVLRLPPEQVCVTERARLGFHAAWFPDMAGGRVMSIAHTQRLHGLYPPQVQYWLARRGGLRPQMIFLHGRELRSFIPPCRTAAWQRSARGEKPRLLAHR